MNRMPGFSGAASLYAAKTQFLAEKMLQVGQAVASPAICSDDGWITCCSTATSRACCLNNDNYCCWDTPYGRGCGTVQRL